MSECARECVHECSSERIDSKDSTTSHNQTYRDHHNNSIQDNGDHDEHLKRLGVDHTPHFVDERLLVRRHVPLSRPSCHGELDTVSLGEASPTNAQWNQLNKSTDGWGIFH